MKKYNSPEIIELKISQTEHDWFGIYWDGGYIGDGEVSGHLSWDEPTPVPTKPPVNPVDPRS